MSHQTVEIDDALAQALNLLDQPLQEAVRETIVLELYRRGTISSGKAGQLLGRSNLEFIQYAGGLGIPYFQFDDDELHAEIERARAM